MLRLLRTVQLLLPMSAARMMAREAPAMPDIEEYRDVPIRAYNVRRRCRPLWQAIAARTTTSERQLVLLPTSGLGDMANAFVAATYLAFRHALRLRALDHRGFNDFGRYFSRWSAGGTKLALGGSELPVPMDTLFKVPARWEHSKVRILAPGVAHIDLTHSGGRWAEGSDASRFDAAMRNESMTWIFLFAGNAEHSKMRQNGLVDAWLPDPIGKGRVGEWDHCALRYAMNIKRHIVQTVPPKPADVLIGIHIRALRFLRALGPNASSVVKAPNLREKNAHAWSGSTRGALQALNWPKGATYFQRTTASYISKIGSGELSLTEALAKFSKDAQAPPPSVELLPHIHDDTFFLDVAWNESDFDGLRRHASTIERRVPAGRSVKWLVLADSPSLLKLLRTAWRDHVVAWEPSVPLHVSWTSQTSGGVYWSDRKHDEGSLRVDLSAQYADWLALGACDYILTTGSGFSTSAQRYSAAVRTVFSQGGGYPASRRVLGAVRLGVKVL